MSRLDLEDKKESLLARNRDFILRHRQTQFTEKMSYFPTKYWHKLEDNKVQGCLSAGMSFV